MDLMRSLWLITDWPLPKSINILVIKSHDFNGPSFVYTLFVETLVTLSHLIPKVYGIISGSILSLFLRLLDLITREICTLCSHYDL